MAKRFIDTLIFDDPWFMELTKDGKLFWMYCITKCDHAGILVLNDKLCKFQTDIKCIETVIKELGNRLIRVCENTYFIPKFINFQYPEFPNSKVRQQQSAIAILCKYGLYDNETNSLLTVSEVLPNTYDNEHDNVIVNVTDTVIEKNNVKFDFYSDFDKCNIRPESIEKFKSLCLEVEKFDRIAKLEKPLTAFSFFTLINEFNKESVIDVLSSMQNTKDLTKKYADAYLTAKNWLKRRAK